MLTRVTLFHWVTIHFLCVSVSSRSVDYPARCRWKQDPGTCSAFLVQYYFNRETGKCETFVYGGCGGNPNRFDTLETCRSSCRIHFEEPAAPLICSTRETPIVDPTKAETKPEEPQVNGTIPVKEQEKPTNPEQPLNSTATEEPVTIKPSPLPPVTTTLSPVPEVTSPVNQVTTVSSTPPPKTREEICFQPFAEGTCKENLIRFYYDPETNKCKKFIFKGCFQYDNNFEKQEDCETLCVLTTTTVNPSR